MIKSNADLVSQNIDMGYIDLIIQKSFNLDQDAIIKFIENLCKVSKEELAHKENPRKFSLQRLVEVADLNMERIRFVWQNIWKILGDHFCMVGYH